MQIIVQGVAGLIGLNLILIPALPKGVPLPFISGEATAIAWTLGIVMIINDG